MPKSSKSFILSNEKVNSHGFIVITAGIDLAAFKKNPIMYWMHRDVGSEKGGMLPIGYWTDIQVNGTELSAIPVFDDNDEFAMNIYHKVEHGTLRAASVALEKPITLDADKSNWVPGQTAPTVLTCRLGEGSIVDRGSNSDAVTLNLGANVIYLSLSSIKEPAPTPTMPNVEKPHPAAKKETDHSHDLKEALKNAVTVGKITQSHADQLLQMPNDADSEDAIKGIVKGTPINPDRIQGRFHHTLIKQAQRSWDEITQRDPGGMNSLKSNAPELYKAKFFEKHGRMPAVI